MISVYCWLTQGTIKWTPSVFRLSAFIGVKIYVGHASHYATSSSIYAKYTLKASERAQSLSGCWNIIARTYLLGRWPFGGAKFYGNCNELNIDDDNSNNTNNTVVNWWQGYGQTALYNILYWLSWGLGGYMPRNSKYTMQCSVAILGVNRWKEMVRARTLSINIKWKDILQDVFTIASI